MQIDSDRVMIEILEEIKSLNNKVINMDNMLKNEKLNRKVLYQIAEYLKDYQSIIDFQLKENDKNNAEIIRELKSAFMKMAIMVAPELVGATRSGSTVISKDTDPVYSLSKSYPLKYAENTIFGITVYNCGYYRVGYLPALGTSYAIVNEGVTQYMGQTQLLSIVSTSAADKGTAPVGTGIQQIRIGGLNSSGYRFSETVTLNGTTPVTTINQFSEVDSAAAISVGSSNFAVGTITIKGETDTTTYGTITIGENSWKSGTLFTDNSSSGYLYSWSFGAYTSAVRAQLVANAAIGNVRAIIARASCIVDNGSVELVFPLPVKIPRQGIVTVRAVAKQTTTEVTTSFVANLKAE